MKPLEIKKSPHTKNNERFHPHQPLAIAIASPSAGRPRLRCTQQTRWKGTAGSRHQTDKLLRTASPLGKIHQETWRTSWG